MVRKRLYITTKEVRSPESLFSPAQLARYLGVSPGYLAGRRAAGLPPAYFKLGPRSVRYRWGDVEAWLQGTRRRKINTP